MEQKSDVLFRAEKEYKNCREKFYLLLREIISNSIHAVIIRKGKEKDAGSTYTPELTLTMIFHESDCSIVLRDNGEGFTKVNSQCFEELDVKNTEKVKYNFHPLGQGRLAIVHFADTALYETVFKGDDGNFKKMTFPYPAENEGLFSLEHFVSDEPTEKDTYTELKIKINKQNTFGRAKTFFKNFEDAKAIKQWFIETFFPFLVTNEDLKVSISFNGDTVSVSKKNIEAEIDSIPFELNPEGDKTYNFKLWLMPNGGRLQGETPIECFARALKAELVGGKLSYVIDSDIGYKFYLTSEYFDEKVDNTGEKIEISSSIISDINAKINALLDEKFKQTIENNQKTTKANLKIFKMRYPSLDVFVHEESFSSSKTVVDEETLVKKAIEAKGIIEKKFWVRMDKQNVDSDEKPFDETEEGQKLLNSSLHIYVKHRERVLERLHELIQMFDTDGNDKPELENSVHDLFFRRGESLKGSDNINHLHNLWILDDKFTTFSDSFKGKSTKQGQKLSDIYIWADDLEEVKQLLILELKSTTKAHNAGNKEESMIAQVKRYASDVYNKPVDTLNWDVDTSKIQFMGIILARKSDINKELTSPNVNGTYEPIPFLANSFYKDDYFTPTPGMPRFKKPIRIELYSFEDIYKLASNRNAVFFKLLKKEFELIEANES